MNYYDILGININSTTKEIKKHYYRLAKKYHPDKNNGDLNKCEDFKLLSEAYTTLSNPKKRLIYDIKIKYNLCLPNGIQLNNEDYEIIHSYYNKIMNWTEIKFLKLLFNSLPDEFKNNVKNKINIFFNNYKCDKIRNISNIKYIDLRGLYENYYINLFRNIDDVCNLNLKQLFLITNETIYHIFITSYNYTLNIKNNGTIVKINILLKSLFKVDKYNLHYNVNINLYEYYFGKDHLLNLNNEFIYHRNKYCEPFILKQRGLKDVLNNKRGDLIITYNLKLDNVDYNKYQSQINEIFNVS